MTKRRQRVYRFSRSENYKTTVDGKVIDLDTRDVEEARRRADRYFAPAGRSSPSGPLKPDEQPRDERPRGAELRSSPAVSSPEFPRAVAPPPAFVAPPPRPSPGEDRMRDLFAREYGAAPTAAPPLEHDAPTAAPLEQPPAPAQGGAGRVDLDEEQIKKMAELAAVLTVQANTIAVGWGVKVFGRRTPGDVDEKWQGINHKAWTALWEKAIGNREPSITGALLVSSIGMAVGMYADGKPIVDVEEAPPPAEAQRVHTPPPPARPSGVLPFTPPEKFSTTGPLHWRKDDTAQGGAGA